MTLKLFSMRYKYDKILLVFKSNYEILQNSLAAHELVLTFCIAILYTYVPLLDLAENGESIVIIIYCQF